MHIPDGFLSAPVWLSLDLAALPAVAYVARRAQSEAPENQIPLLGAMGAFVFAAQMINFPVGAGTSGHLLGSALLALVLGPAAACVVMTAILMIQALVFQDGGVLALGANTFNMSLAGVAAGYLPWRLWGAAQWRKFAVFAGGMLSVLVGAALAFTELWFSGVPMPRPLLVLSGGLFLLAGAIEGGITLAVFQAVERMNRSWVRDPRTFPLIPQAAVTAAAAILAMVGVLAASAAPDILESFSRAIGLGGKERALVATPFGGYEAEFIRSSWLSKATAGLAGLVAVVLCVWAWGRFLARRRNA